MFGTFGKHTYTLAAEGIKVHSESFTSREAANSRMYALIGKFGLSLKEVYDDKHFKTYIFKNGVRIHINRD